MRRRDFTTLALAGTAGTIAAPAIVKAEPATFKWKMTSFYGPNAYFYSEGPGSAKDLCKRIKDMSNGRLSIDFYGAGELIPARAGFDAVSSGTVEMNYANSYFWTGKSFAAQYFAAVPFGMNFVGLNGWMYDGGGLELWHEVYDKFNLVPFLAGNTGVQMTGWFRKPIEKVSDLKGLKMRIPGLAGQVYRSLGVDAQLLAPGDIFPALERGVIDAAEFVGPYLDRQLGLQKVAKYYYTTGWHETATASEVTINKAAWNKLAARPQGHRRERLHGLQRARRSLVPEGQRRSDGRPDQEPGRACPTAARCRGGSPARGERKDHRRGRRQGSVTKKVNDSYMELHEDLYAVGEVQRKALLRQILGV